MLNPLPYLIETNTTQKSTGSSNDSAQNTQLKNRISVLERGKHRHENQNQKQQIEMNIFKTRLNEVIELLSALNN